MATRCTVCNHPLVAEADKALAAGATVEAVARMLGVTRNSAGRHRANHLTAPAWKAARAFARNPLPPVPPVEIDPDASTGEQMKALVDRLAAMDVNHMTPAQQVAHFDAHRRALESLSKMAGPAEPTEVAMDQVTGLSEFLSDAFVALEPFPDARRALIPVVARWFPKPEPPMG